MLISKAWGANAHPFCEFCELQWRQRSKSPKGPTKQNPPKEPKLAATGQLAPGAQVTLSSENEVRLRRLLQNTGGLNASVPQVQESLTEGQRKQAGKRLKNIYDNLIAEGFSSSQIELALAALPVVLHLSSPYFGFCRIRVKWMEFRHLKLWCIFHSRYETEFRLTMSQVIEPTFRLKFVMFSVLLKMHVIACPTPDQIFLWSTMESWWIQWSVERLLLPLHAMVIVEYSSSNSFFRILSLWALFVLVEKF